MICRRLNKNYGKIEWMQNHIEAYHLDVPYEEGDNIKKLEG